MEPARLFIVGNHEMKSREGITQGDLTAIRAYTLGVTPLILFLSEFISINKHRKGFWVRSQQAFFDVKVFDPNPNRYLDKGPSQCYIQNEKEKKYNERVLEIYHGNFTPLLLSSYGGMEENVTRFITD